MYNYIKIIRPNLEKQLNNSYPPYPDSRSLPYAVAYAESNRLEALIEERETWALNKIIEHRAVLWT